MKPKATPSPWGNQKTVKFVFKEPKEFVCRRVVVAEVGLTNGDMWVGVAECSPSEPFRLKRGVSIAASRLAWPARGGHFLMAAISQQLLTEYRSPVPRPGLGPPEVAFVNDSRIRTSILYREVLGVLRREHLLSFDAQDDHRRLERRELYALRKQMARLSKEIGTFIFRHPTTCEPDLFLFSGAIKRLSTSITQPLHTEV